jgi:hypothetical protein
VKIKLHITGYAVAYDNIRRPTKSDLPPLPSRPQGSLYSQQKHAVADAVEYMRVFGKHKPRIFVLTTPGFIDHAQEGKKISAFTTNLRNNYGMDSYVWVREFTARGYPHYHFVADIPKFDAVHLSRYWSGLHGVDALNSIRLGTAPRPGRPRKFWIDNQRMSWYMTKYIGKGIGDCEKGALTKSFRTFAISQELKKNSQPLIYESEIHHTFSNQHLRSFYLSEDQIEPNLPTTFNPHIYSWKWTGHGNSYTGFPKRVDKRRVEKT